MTSPALSNMLRDLRTCFRGRTKGLLLEAFLWWLARGEPLRMELDDMLAKGLLILAGARMLEMGLLEERGRVRS